MIYQRSRKYNSSKRQERLLVKETGDIIHQRDAMDDLSKKQEIFIKEIREIVGQRNRRHNSSRRQER